MISIKYKNLYDAFIKHYKDTHVNPWHEISEDELQAIYDDLTGKMEVDDDYTFNYLMNYIIKRLSGLEDAHTEYDDWKFIPLLFRVFDNEVYISWPLELKGEKVLTINSIPVQNILDELEDIITYGTEGKKIHQYEKSLFNAKKLYGLPSLRGSSNLIFRILDKDGLISNHTYEKDIKYPCPPFYGYWEDNATYKIEGDALIYKHFSVQKQFEEKIQQTFLQLEKEDLSNVSKIIIDLRGNTGGNSNLNKPLIDFVNKNQDKTLIVLTDYRIFSGGRYALVDLIKAGAITIGGKIGTPLNCYGNSNWIRIDNYAFSASESYLSPGLDRSIFAHSKEDFQKNITKSDLVLNIFEPDIYVEETIEDFLRENDPVMDEAINYQPSNRLK